MNDGIFPIDNNLASVDLNYGITHISQDSDNALDVVASCMTSLISSACNSIAFPFAFVINYYGKPLYGILNLNQYPDCKRNVKIKLGFTIPLQYPILHLNQYSV